MSTQAKSKSIPPQPVLPDLSASPFAAWLTLERLAYIVLVLVALLIRILDLGGRPLAPAEVSTALQAWQASQGLETSLDTGAPLLFSLQWLTFFIYGGASAGLARAWPLLASVALPLVIYDWRRWVGRGVALLAAVLVTFSPLVNAFGRRGDGAALTLLALALALAGWGRVRAGDQRGWTLAAVGLGLILISGAAAPAAILALALLLLLDQLSGERALTPPTTTHGMILLAVVLVGGSAFLTRLNGVGLMAVGWSEWLGWFTLKGQSLLWGALRLLLDEPLLASTAVAAIVWSWRRRDASRVFTLTTLALMVVNILQGPDATPTRAVLALVAAAPVAAFLLWLFRVADYAQTDAESGLYLVVFMVLLVLGVFSLIAYARAGQINQLYLLVASVTMAVVLTVVFGFFIGWPRVLGMAALALLVSLALYNAAMAWGIGYDAALPRFPALYETDTRPGIEDLTATVNDLSERQRGDQWALAIALLTGGPADDLLQWQLRQAEDLRLVLGVSLETAPPLVVAPASNVLPLSERYAGQDFAILDDWDPAQGDLRQQIEWALFRIAPWTLPTQNYVLWADTTVLNPQ